MLLTLTTTHHPATDLGYLLHKNPARVQTFETNFGCAHVFYPEATAQRCTAALLLDVDPVGLVRGKTQFRTGLMDQYVNDRPYAACSFTSVAMSQILKSAMAGQCKERPDLVNQTMPLEATVSALRCPSGQDLIDKLFLPLGYQVTATRHPLDEQFPEWGESPYYTLTLSKATTVRELLTHLYVLIPVFDNHKHYYIADDELDKLLSRGEGWLAAHPERETIAYRYLRYRPSLARQALEQLAQNDEVPVPDPDAETPEAIEETQEKPLRLNQERMQAVAAALQASGAKRVLDLGCGQGNLLRELVRIHQFTEIVGLDVSIAALESAAERLRLDRMPENQKQRIRLLHGSLVYRDKRLAGFDAAAVVEVVEHFDPPRLIAFERALFQSARPRVVVLTTPNREYNVVWESLAASATAPLRHSDHRFEWTRGEFRSWCERIASQFAYAVEYAPVGPLHEEFGSPTQMATYTRID